MKNTYHLLIIFPLTLSGLAHADIGDSDREVRQKNLDQACEQARERKLAPERNRIIQECINSGRTQHYCIEFNKDYGARMGDRAPLYLDLPACVKAFEYKRSYRSGN